MISLQPVASTIDLGEVFADHAPPRLRLHFDEHAKVAGGLMCNVSAMAKTEGRRHRCADGTYIIRDFNALSRVLNAVGAAVIPNLIHRLRLSIAEGRYDFDDSIVEDIDGAAALIETMRADLSITLSIDALPRLRPGAAQ